EDRMKKIYFEFYQATYRPTKIDRKTKELIAIAASLGFRCQGCLDGHIKKAQKFGASAEEISESIAIAMGVAAASVVDLTERAAGGPGGVCGRLLALASGLELRRAPGRARSDRDGSEPSEPERDHIRRRLFPVRQARVGDGLDLLLVLRCADPGRPAGLGGGGTPGLEIGLRRGRRSGAGPAPSRAPNAAGSSNLRARRARGSRSD